MSQPEAAIEVYEQNTTLLRCKLEMRQVQGGHTTQNLQQIWSELWHMNQACKPGVLGLSSASQQPPPARKMGTSLVKASRSPEVKRAERRQDLYIIAVGDDFASVGVCG